MQANSGVDTSLHRMKFFDISRDMVGKFNVLSSSISREDIDFLPFKRLLLAGYLLQVVNSKFSQQINSVLQDYDFGCVVISFPNDLSLTEYIKCATAVSHLISRPIPEPSGKYYGLTTVLHTTKPPLKILDPYQKFTLHTDGIFHDNPVDWLMMFKVEERHAVGGESRLLHIDDWEDFESFYIHPENAKKYKFGLIEKDRRYDIFSKVSCMKPAQSQIFKRNSFGKQVKFVDQFVQPETITQAIFIDELQKSLEGSASVHESYLPVGSMIILNNNIWLHGRSPFQVDEDLTRTLLRQYGYFPGQHDHFENEN